MSPPPAATLTTDSLLRATARIQEAHEPTRQKPIIKFDPQQQQHLNQANQLAGSVRASIDSGRDNPFRPDGEIYKLTNPIVDYYKFGPNQSRSVTPTYAELDYYSSKNKRKRKAAAKRAAQDETRQSNWRCWFCCCRRRRGSPSSEPPNQRQAGQESVGTVAEEAGNGGKPNESDLSGTNNGQVSTNKTKAKRSVKKQVHLEGEAAKEANTTTTNQINGAHSNSSTAVKTVEGRASCNPTELTNESQKTEPREAATTTKVKTIETDKRRCVVS